MQTVLVLLFISLKWCWCDAQVEQSNVTVAIGFELSEYKVHEDDGSMEVGVRVFCGSIPQGTTVTLRMSTEDGTATSPDDYIPLSRALVALNSTHTRRTVNIGIVEDSKEEAAEFFLVHLEMVDVSSGRVRRADVSLDISLGPVDAKINIQNISGTAAIVIAGVVFTILILGGLIFSCIQNCATCVKTFSD